jgi:AraC family transcriptional regulator of adaptative response / DNA-3-methyladenine glycosylase II
MELDLKACQRARRSRDPRFDGKFFIGVKTTGVYCRPVCPAPEPRERNVLYFPSAAAAATAGFRPCLRCRPESSPGTPAWLGTSTTVARALRLIGERGLEGPGVEDLAARLGIGSRHLRRLFLQHLGATPVAVLQTRRVHFAKKLIDESDLPFSEVARAAGFGSTRRFNAGFRLLYGRTPTALRRLARCDGGSPAGHYRFRLGFRPPFDWRGLLEFLGARAIPGVESVENGCYRRTIALDGRAGHFEARLVRGAFELAIHFPEPRALVEIVERARRLFDLGADPGPIRAHIGGDALLARLVAARPGRRVPGAWDGFELAVRAVLGQQVSVKGATTLAGRIARAFGEPVAGPGGLTRLFPTPAALARADLSTIGLPRRRAEAIRALAQAVLDGRLSFSGVADAGRFVEGLRSLPGVGEWTAQYVAMRALGEPDAFPAGDLGLLRASGLRSVKELERRAETWRPWRAYAAMHLWQGGKRDGKRLHHAGRQSHRAAAARGR